MPGANFSVSQIARSEALPLDLGLELKMADYLASFTDNNKKVNSYVVLDYIVSVKTHAVWTKLTFLVFIAIFLY